MSPLKGLLDSLAIRTVLLVVAIVAVAEVATFSLVFHHGKASHVNRTARYVTGQIRTMQTVLPGLDDQARQRLESIDPGEQWLRLRPDGPFVPEKVANFDFADDLENELRHMLGQKVELRMRGSLWIGFEAGGERWWLVLPPPRFKQQDLPPDLWVKLGVALVVLVLMAGAFVRSIVGPLTRLAEAVAATGDGSACRVIPEGPKEVRRLAERHNTMVVQLAHAEAERREMLAGLTHDLRAPLARLRVRLALLENDTERTGLERDAEDMERIIDQCLSFLRSEAGDLPPPSALCLADAVSDEVAHQRELGRPVEIVVSPEVAACSVAIERGDLRRMLDNLIGNALQHGAPPVEIGLSTAQSARIVLSVRDHGSGIAEADRQRVLEAFVQGEPARATRGSCGLGLAIVRRIADRCGAEMTLGNTASGGLEVRVLFPCVAADET